MRHLLIDISALIGQQHTFVRTTCAGETFYKCVYAFRMVVNCTHGEVSVILCMLFAPFPVRIWTHQPPATTSHPFPALPYTQHLRCGFRQKTNVCQCGGFTRTHTWPFVSLRRYLRRGFFGSSHPSTRHTHYLIYIRTNYSQKCPLQTTDTHSWHTHPIWK